MALNRSEKKTAVTTAVFSFGDANTSPNGKAITLEPVTLPLPQRNLLNPLGRQLHRLQPHA